MAPLDWTLRWQRHPSANCASQCRGIVKPLNFQACAGLLPASISEMPMNAASGKPISTSPSGGIRDGAKDERERARSPDRRGHAGEIDSRLYQDALLAAARLPRPPAPSMRRTSPVRLEMAVSVRCDGATRPRSVHGRVARGLDRPAAGTRSPRGGRRGECPLGSVSPPSRLTRPR